MTKAGEERPNHAFHLTALLRAAASEGHVGLHDARRKTVKTAEPEPVADAAPGNVPPNRPHKLWRVERDARAREFSEPAASRSIIDGILDDIDSYDAAPNTWHTLAMIAGRVDHYEARLIIVQAGLRQWPENVDLLCEEVQMLSTPTEGYNPKLGKAKWERLRELDRTLTGPYWRFWVYGAIYLARHLNQPEEALRFLDEGLTHVIRDSLMDIFRSYRRVLVDSVPLRTLESEEAVREYQEWATRTLEQRLTLGLELGLENGYVLATELAQLYQERRGVEEGDENLHKALSYLDAAEKLYTGSENHPIWEIYVPRARILIALRRHGDALKLLRSLPRQVRDDRSIEALLQLASLTTGEPLEAGSPEDQSPMQQATSGLPVLLANDGDLLFSIARQHEHVGSVVLSVAQRLVDSRERGSE